MTYRLGIDLGTTFTAAAVANGGAPTMLGLGNRALQVPSVLYLPADGELVVGEAAERRGAMDPSRVVREFKRRIGDQVPMLVGGVPYSPQSLTAQLLHWVVGAATEQKGEPPQQVVLTYPANWGQYKRDLLTQVIELADVGDVQTCSEPVAAALQYAARERVRPGDRIAVYDLGGGTFDTCVLEKTDESFAMLGEPVGIEHLGGIDFDDAVFQHVLDALGEQADDLDATDPLMQAALSRLRRDCVEAKEALSSDVFTVVPVVLPGLSTSVRMTRGELEDLIRPPLKDTVAAVGRSLRSAGVEPAELQAIVLVGGGSRIPLVRELLQQAFAVPIALDTHPKHDIALGAVLAAVPDRGRDQTVVLPAMTGDTMVGVPAAVPLEPDRPTAAASPFLPGPLEPDPSFVPGRQFRPGPVTEPWSPKPPATTGGWTWTWPPSGRVAIAVAAVAALAVAAGVIFLTRPDGGAGNSGRPAAATPSTGVATALSPPPAVNPLVAALPVSAPLSADELVVPMRKNKDWDVYLGKIGTDAPIKRLTSSNIQGGAPFPVLSADRRTIIFVHQVGEFRTLRVMAADGTGQRALFSHIPAECASSTFRPAWNPRDESEIAVACTDRQGSRRLYLIRIDGKILRELPVGFPWMDDEAFSPDGSQLAYQAGPNVTIGSGSVYIFNLNTGGSQRRLDTLPAGGEADPTWSPDGSLIAFRRQLDDGTKTGNFDIFVAPPDGSRAPKDVVTDGADEQDPSWSPDGSELAYKSSRLDTGEGHGPVRIWLGNADGSDARVLWTHGGGTEQTAAAWTRR